MGTRGPVPKHSSERRRQNKPEGGEITVVRARLGAVEQPPASPDWHPIARDWYESLAESGQAQFYEPSDWAVARYVAELMSRALSSDRPPNGQYVAALNSAMSSLLTTEGDRRRARMELERKKPGPKLAPVKPLDAYRDIAGG